MTEKFTVTTEVQNSIARKAQELYEKRIAPYAAGLSEEQQQTIIEFQKLIFILDHYGETTENIEPLILSDVWQRCEKFLSELHISTDLQNILLQDLKDYAEIEANTRQGKKLMDYPIRSFYFKKSCDVRLQRHLIRILTQQAAVSSPEEVSRDILEEIEDDIDDIEEDKATQFNGNRLLEVLESGDESKFNEYIDFINSLSGVPQELVSRIQEKIKFL